MPPMPDARASARVSSRRTVGVAVDLVAGDDVEGQRQQAVAGEDRGGVVGLLVQGRAAAAQVAVVHRRQVVMDQRIAVDAFERGADQQRGLARHAEHGRALDHQERPQPLAAAEARIAHRLHQPLRPGDLVGQQRIGQQSCQQRFGILRGLVQALGKIGRWRCRSSRIAPDQFGRTIVYGTGFVNSMQRARHKSAGKRTGYHGDVTWMAAC